MEEQQTNARWVNSVEAGKILGNKPATVRRNKDRYKTNGIEGKGMAFWLPSLLPDYEPDVEKSAELLQAEQEVAIATKLKEAAELYKTVAVAQKEKEKALAELEELKNKRLEPDKIDKLREDVKDMVAIVRQEIIQSIADIEAKTKTFKQIYNKSVQEYNEHTTLFNRNYELLNNRLSEVNNNGENGLSKQVSKSN